MLKPKNREEYRNNLAQVFIQSLEENPQQKNHQKKKLTILKDKGVLIWKTS